MSEICHYEGEYIVCEEPPTTARHYENYSIQSRPKQYARQNNNEITLNEWKVREALYKWMKQNNIHSTAERIKTTISPNDQDGSAGYFLKQIFGDFKEFTFPVFKINSTKTIGGYRLPGIAMVCRSETEKYTEANETLHAFLHRRYPLFAEKWNHSIENFSEIFLSIGLYRMDRPNYTYHQLNEYLSDLIGGLVDPTKAMKYCYGNAVGPENYFLSYDISSSIMGLISSTIKKINNGENVKANSNSTLEKKVVEIVNIYKLKLNQSGNIMDLTPSIFNELNMIAAKELLDRLYIVKNNSHY